VAALGYNISVIPYLTLIDDRSPLVRYRDGLADPSFNIFYDSPALVLIYANVAAGPYAEGDCCMVAQTLMLAAHDTGLGTCWIGFAQPFFDLTTTKAEMGVPEAYRLVAPIIVGVPSGAAAPVDRRVPHIAFWM
jgi:nitroreductase